MPEPADEPAPPGEPEFAVEAAPGSPPIDVATLERFLAAVAHDISPGDGRGASLRIVSDAEIRELNRRYRGKDRPTDVLAFPVSDPGDGPDGDPLVDPWRGEEPAYLGDLVVSVETAARQAAEESRTLDAELRHLALHGLLHLFGHDHEVDRGEMARLERLLRLRHGLISR